MMEASCPIASRMLVRVDGWFVIATMTATVEKEIGTGIGDFGQSQSHES